MLQQCGRHMHGSCRSRRRPPRPGPLHEQTVPTSCSTMCRCIQMASCDRMESRCWLAPSGMARSSSPWAFAHPHVPCGAEQAALYSWFGEMATALASGWMQSDAVQGTVGHNVCTHLLNQARGCAPSTNTPAHPQPPTALEVAQWRRTMDGILQRGHKPVRITPSPPLSKPGEAQHSVQKHGRCASASASRPWAAISR